MNFTFLLRRGAKVDIPDEAGLAEPLITTDTDELYLGKGVGEVPVPLKVAVVNITNLPVIKTKKTNYTVAGSTGDIVEIQVTWDSAFADTNYAITVTLEAPHTTMAVFPLVMGISDVTAAGFKVQFKIGDAGLVGLGVVFHAIGIKL